MRTETTRYLRIRRARLAVAAQLRSRTRLRQGFGEARRSASGAKAAFTTAAAILIGGGSSVFACPVCFGAAESSMIDGAKLGVLVMVGVTLAVQGAFVAFFLYLRNRAKRIADIELDNEWSELQGVSRTS